mgnify:CR=1 FL=1
MNYNYLLKELKKVNKKVNKVFYYLKNQETEKYDCVLQINLNRLCDIDEILSYLQIELEIKLGIDEESKVRNNDN